MIFFQHIMDRLVLIMFVSAFPTLSSIQVNFPMKFRLKEDEPDLRTREREKRQHVFPTSGLRPKTSKTTVFSLIDLIYVLACQVERLSCVPGVGFGHG